MSYLRVLQTVARGVLVIVEEMIATLGTIGASFRGLLFTMYSAVESTVRFPIRFIRAPNKSRFLRETKRRFLLNFTLLKRRLLWFVHSYPHKALFRSAFALWLVAVVVLGQASMQWRHGEEEESYRPRSVARSFSQEHGVEVQTESGTGDTKTVGATGVTSRRLLPSSRDTVAKQYVYAGNTDSTSGGTTTSADTNGSVLGENTTPTPVSTLTPTPTPTTPLGASTPTPTGTLTPTSTPVPTSTPTPTHIPTPTNTPTPTPDPGVLAVNVPRGYKVVLASDNTTDVSKVGQHGWVDVWVYKGGVLLAEIPVDFDAGPPDFDGFYGSANVTERKSFISVPTTLSQYSETHTLFIPKLPKDNKATICPEAFSYDDIYQFCPNRINVSDGYVNGAVAVYDLGNYWRVEGMTGTGGSSTYVNQAKDVMTRQQVDTLSSHTISFVLSASETFTGMGNSVDNEWVMVDFHEDDSGFIVDGASLTTSDVTFNDGTSRTIVDIGASPTCTGGVNDMVVVVDDTAGTLKFQTCDNYTASATGATILINIGASAGGTDRVTNPSTVGSQSIDFPNNFGDADFGIAVPIMDSDQVSISASVDTYINFDIDVSEGHGDSDASYAIDLGELMYTSVTTESSIKEIYVDIDTNADDGAIIQVASGFGASGLYSSSSGDTIPSVSGTLTTNSLNGGYGLAAKTLNTQDEGTLVPVSPYDVFGAANDVGKLLTTFQTIFNTGGNPGAPIVGGSGEIAVRAVAGTSTSAGDDYTDTLTFRAVAVY